MFPGLDLPEKANPAQPLTAAGEGLDNISVDHDISDLSDLYPYFSAREQKKTHKRNYHGRLQNNAADITT